MDNLRFLHVKLPGLNPIYNEFMRPFLQHCRRPIPPIELLNSCFQAKVERIIPCATFLPWHVGPRWYSSRTGCSLRLFSERIGTIVDNCSLNRHYTKVLDVMLYCT